ncbi:MAG TPA: DNA polymerase III subunit beta [Burkholderiaceae bacterium]|jgi:DNA polymerase-3 subunit beta|nr:DNA polymerase III subunit beta [Burkholderiaceae bacterium]
MSFVKAPRDALLKPLQVVSGIVERRQTLPILANVLLRKEGEHLSFTATDLEIQIQTGADIGSGKETLATTVSARKLVDILRALPEAEVSLSLANRKLTLASGRSRFALQTLAAEEFPTVAQAEFSADFTLPAATLKYLLSMVHFAMAAQDIRYYLNGMLLVVDGGLLRAVATDGHRLALCEVSKDGGATPRLEAIVPRKTILELMRLLPDAEESVRVQMASNQVKFTFGGIELISKLVEGKFPDYMKVIPVNNQKVFVIDRGTLMAALQRVAILTTEKFKGVRCVLAPNTLKISSTNADQEEAQEELEIDYGGEPLDIGFNVTYLTDVLGNLKSEAVRFALGDSLGSALVTIPDSERFKYVVMPMRI